VFDQLQVAEGSGVGCDSALRLQLRIRLTGAVASGPLISETVDFAFRWVGMRERGSGRGKQM